MIPPSAQPPRTQTPPLGQVFDHRLTTCSIAVLSEDFLKICY